MVERWKAVGVWFIDSLDLAEMYLVNKSGSKHSALPSLAD